MRGQIAIFIILGILALLALSFTLYAAGTFKKTVLKSKVGVDAVTDLVSSCLFTVGEEALLALGASGFRSVNQSSGNAIIAPDGTVGERSSSIPEYPFPGFPYTNGSLLFTGYYGVSLLPQLYGPSQSVEHMLNLFIEENIVSCANWQSFLEASVTAGAPHAQLVIARSLEDFEHEDSITLQLDWPMNVSSKDQIVYLERFTARLPVRLATVYYLAKGIVDADVSDISYVPIVPSGFVLEKKRSENKKVSVLGVNDLRSLVRNAPFEITLARQNRHPALWQINDSLFGQLHVTLEGKGALFSVEENALVISDPCPDGPNPVMVQLNASDPDEDTVSFRVDLPMSSDNRLPKSAIGVQYSFTVYASDGSLDDFQKIPLEVALCEVR